MMNTSLKSLIYLFKELFEVNVFDLQLILYLSTILKNQGSKTVSYDKLYKERFLADGKKGLQNLLRLCL